MHWKFRANDATLAIGARAEFLRFIEAQQATSDDCFRAELVFGELVGNVVRHAPGPITVAFAWSGEKATLSVCDYGPGFVLPSGPVADDSESGRGLLIVQSLVKNLRVTKTMMGTSVTASLNMTHTLPKTAAGDVWSLPTKARVAALV